MCFSSLVNFNFYYDFGSSEGILLCFAPFQNVKLKSCSYCSRLMQILTKLIMCGINYYIFYCLLLFVCAWSVIYYLAEWVHCFATRHRWGSRRDGAGVGGCWHWCQHSLWSLWIETYHFFSIFSSVFYLWLSAALMLRTVPLPSWLLVC